MRVVQKAERDCLHSCRNIVFPRAGRFTKKHRLNRPEEYQHVFRSSCRSKDNYLMVIARKNGLGYARLGLAISRKRIKAAVTRNRIKRIARESFRINQKLLKGLDIVVTTHTQMVEADNRKLAKSLTDHWQKLTECKNY